MLPPERRLVGVRKLVDDSAYLVLHAPRQVGKTTALRAFAQTLTAEGRYAALLVSMETGAAFPGNVGAAEEAVLGAWRERARTWLPQELQPPPWPEAAAGSKLRAALGAWCRATQRPLVLFLDEIDALEGDVLISVLRQLRDGHADRPRGAPWSLALIGMRDVRDYKVASGGPDRAHSASPFNVIDRSLTLRAFTADEVAELYAQHTAETGQRFEADASRHAFELTQGQPWLVNALARVAVEELATDHARDVTAADIERAKEVLIARQETHMDSLAERLRDARVRAVIEPMMLGDRLPPLPTDDLRYVLDLGLLRQTADGALVVANPIYREILARELSTTVRASLPAITPTWLAPDGALDPARLLDAFMAFWREHGEALLGAAPYPEVAAHLVMMAFLHRVANGGGTVDREYALGRGRMDLCVRLRGVTLAIELKVWRDGQRDPAPSGLTQLDAYLDALGQSTGWLVVFDQRAKRAAPSKRMRAAKRATPSGRSVTLVRL